MLAFAESHPQYDTHELVRRARPALPRFIGDVPVQPAETADDEDESAWAAYCLANYSIYTADAMPAAPYHVTAQRWFYSLRLPGLSSAVGMDSTTTPAPAQHPAPAATTLDALEPTATADPNATDANAPQDVEMSCSPRSPLAGSSPSKTTSHDDSVDVTADCDISADLATKAANLQIDWDWESPANALGHQQATLLPLTAPKAAEAAGKLQQYSPVAAVRMLGPDIQPAHLSYLIMTNADNRSTVRARNATRVLLRRKFMDTALGIAEHIGNTPYQQQHPDDEEWSEDELEDYEQQPYDVNESTHKAVAAWDLLQMQTLQDDHNRRAPFSAIATDDMPAGVQADDSVIVHADSDSSKQLHAANQAAKALLWGANTSQPKVQMQLPCQSV